MTAYKYLSKDLTSFYKFQWEIGKKFTIEISGNEMCSEQVFHCYNNALLAEFIRPIHLLTFTEYDLYLIEVDDFCNTDGLKYASKSQTVIKKIDRPVITAEQKVEIAIRIAKTVCDDSAWNVWADKWLSGEDRTVESAAYTAAVSNAAYAYTAAYAAYTAANYTVYRAAAYCAHYRAAANVAHYTASAVDYVARNFTDKEEFNRLLIENIEQVISK